MPEQGQIAIFDRSWYGRVLVERLEGFCTDADWRRAYSEINQFERQLTDFGTIVFKFWMHISKQERCAASVNARAPITKPGRSPMRTGAIAASGRITSPPPKRCC